MFKASPVWSIQAKYPTPNVSATPSPTDYHPQKYKVQATPSWKIGSAKRGKENKGLSPGPGHYETDYSTKNKKLGKFGLQNYRAEKNENSPDPGTYSANVSLTKPNSARVKFNQAQHQNCNQNTPGPGSYRTGNSYLVKSGKIGRAERFSGKKEESPGPGSYSAAKSWFKEVSVSFTMTKKDWKIDNDNPGPASYNHQENWLNKQKSKGFSFSGKNVCDNESLCPGPSDYNPLTRPSSPTYSIRQKYQKKAPEERPGPSDYKSSTTFLRKQPSYTIGHEKRERHEEGSQPGPGAYEMPARSTSPSYSLKGSRLKERPSFQPGPSSYNPDKNYVKRRPVSAKFGKSQRNQRYDEKIPGPGEYNYSGRPSSPQVSFTKKKKDNNFTTFSPGPGSYDIKPLMGNPTF